MNRYNNNSFNFFISLLKRLNICKIIILMCKILLLTVEKIDGNLMAQIRYKRLLELYIYDKSLKSLTL